MQSCLHFCWYLSLWTLTSIDILSSVLTTNTFGLFMNNKNSEKPLGSHSSSLLLLSISLVPRLFLVEERVSTERGNEPGDEANFQFPLFLPHIIKHESAPLVFELWPLLTYCLFWGELIHKRQDCVKCSLIPRLPWPPAGEPETITPTYLHAYTFSHSWAWEWR